MPCEIVNSVLFVLDGLCDYFSIEDDEVIMYEVVKMGLEMWETQYDPNNTQIKLQSYSTTTCTIYGV